MAREDHIIHLKNGCLTGSNPRPKIDQMTQAAVNGQHVVIHFHGGLVNYASGMDIVDRLLPFYSASNAYPLFFVWESGLIEILRNNFEEIAKERLFRILWKRIGAIVARKFSQNDGDRAAFVLLATDTRVMKDGIDKALDDDDLQQLEFSEEQMPAGVDELGRFERKSLESELSMDAQLNLEIQKVSSGLRKPADVESEVRSRSPAVRGSSVTLMDPRALDQLVERQDSGERGLVSSARLIKAIVSIAAQVISRFVKNRDHGFHATIVEEILRELYLANVGEFVWSTMKKDTADAFKPGGDVHGGRALLESMANLVSAGNTPRITLVGHSTGAIYISKFLDLAVQLLPADQKYEVIFLAPASSCELTAATLVKHESKIEEFRMFTMTDDYEKKDQLVKILYPHSLLYFVSGVVEGGFDVPLVGMERYYDKAHYKADAFSAVETVRNYVNSVPSHAVWSVSSAGADGLRSASEKHGDFDNDQQTLESIAHMLAFGF
jgi:hypothetical protein